MYFLYRHRQPSHLFTTSYAHTISRPLISISCSRSPSFVLSFVRSFWLLAADSFLHTFFICSHLIWIETMMILCMRNGCIFWHSPTRRVPPSPAHRLRFLFLFSINKYKWRRNEFVVAVWAKRRWIWLTRSIDPMRTTYEERMCVQMMSLNDADTQ